MGIVVAMFLIQVARAAHTALSDRLEYAMLTMDGADEHAARRAMAPERAPQLPTLPGPHAVRALVPLATPVPRLPEPPWQSWTEVRTDLTVRMVAARGAGPVGRALQEATGVRQRRVGQHRKWFAPSILILVTLPRDVTPGMRISARPSVVPDAERVSLHNPVLDHVLRIATPDPTPIRAMVLDPHVHEPLIELMARHPLSVVTERVVALWCAQAVNDPEPLVALAEEVARAMLAFAEPPPAE